MLVELLKLHGVVFELRRESAACSLLFRPVTICEDLSIKLDSGSDHVLESLCLLELVHQIFRYSDVIEHGCKLIDCIVTALNLQFLEHQLLCILREGGLI